jgi:hypothetical protein
MEAAVSPLTALVARIDRDSLADTLLATFLAEIPGYGRLPESVVRGEILDVIRQNIDLCLDWVAGGGLPDSARFDEFRTSAKNRASEGVPLEDLLRAYRLGGTAAWRVLVAEAAPDERDELPYAAELIMNYLDQVSGVVAGAYLDERQHLVSELERGARALLDALLEGEPLDPTHHQTAAKLRFPIAGKLAAFAATLPGEETTGHARAAAGLRMTGVLALTEGDRIVGLAAPDHPLADGLPAGAVIVVDAAVPRDELAASLADVRFGIEVALRDGHTGTVDLEELALDLLLAWSPRVAAILRRRALDPLGPASGRTRGELRKTVATYVALRRDRQETAELLHIHPNTLDNRLRRAHELTGLDLDDPEDLAAVVLALHEPL